MAGFAAGARDDASDGVAVRGALGEGTLPHATRPATRRTGQEEFWGNFVFTTQNIGNLAELASW